MLTHKGKLYGDLSVARLDEETFYLFGSGAAQEMHRRWFEHHAGESGFTYRNCSDDIHGIAISGPNSRELLSRVTRDDVSGRGFQVPRYSTHHGWRGAGDTGTTLVFG